VSGAQVNRPTVDRPQKVPLGAMGLLVSQPEVRAGSRLRRGQTALKEVRRLGRTLKRRAADVLAYFDRPGTSNGPTEAINGRLEHLRGSALGFRNLTNYIARALLETGGFRPRLHPHSG